MHSTRGAKDNEAVQESNMNKEEATHRSYDESGKRSEDNPPILSHKLPDPS